jgi:hypothetical protein
MRANRSIKDSLKEYLNWCVSRLLLGGSRNDTVRDMVDAISDEIASGGGGLNIPAYIFPGDPSKLDSSASSTHITLILGTASDFLDAFNNGKVFVSKTVTFNEVQVPSDITYSLLKSIDPDNPTIFQIIMSTVVWGHYIEITIDFENNEYQAINNTINGSISVNTSGTSN